MRVITRMAACLLLGAACVSTIVSAQEIRSETAELTNDYDAAETSVAETVPVDPAAVPDGSPSDVIEPPPEQPGVDSGCPRCGKGCCNACRSCCPSCCCERNLLSPVVPPCRLLPQDGCFKMYGWVDAGAPMNFANPGNHFNGPFNAQSRDQIQLNQLYMVAERGWTPATASTSVAGSI